MENQRPTRSQLVRHVLSESLVLAVLGGVVGLGLTVATAVAFGLGPALAEGRRDLGARMR